MRRVAFVSAWNSGYDELAKVTLPNREEYCKRHGYDLITVPDWTGDRGPQWARIAVAIKQLAKYDTVFVMDIDAIITNPDFDFKWLAATSRSLTATEDINGFNCGMLLLNQSVWTLDFMRRYWDAGKFYSHHVNPEQTCMAHMLICEPQKEWEIVSQRKFNSFRYELFEYGPYPEGQWQKGDFILHLPSLDNDQRIKIFNAYLSSYR